MNQIFFTLHINHDQLSGFNSLRRGLYGLVCAIAIWLHLRCGLSRANTNIIMQALDLLITAAVNFGLSLAHIYDHNSLDVDATLQNIPDIPHDVRTAIATLSIEPTINRSVCCPKCYSKYSVRSMPDICNRRETSRSRICGEKLWTIRSSRSGPRQVPCCLYSTQDFGTWLEWFLSRPGIEDLIDKSYDHQVSPDVMRSLWDSPAWRSLGDFTITRGNLTFAYFIDWFNPLLNKAAGKSVSCGAIMLVCLNLPYEQQHLIENTYFAGITPPPKEPTMTSITELSNPIVDQLCAWYEGKNICSHRHPAGAFKRVAVLPIIADIRAIRKALGFADVTSHNFCSFCNLRRTDIECLDPSYWSARVATDVRMAAVEWQQATTKKRRKEIYDEHGVRWSSLHQLHYRDHVKHTILGPMHNWIEGIVQHHVRVKWGIGAVPSSLKDQGVDQPTGSPEGTPRLTNLALDADYDMLDDELADLEVESQQYSDTPSHTSRVHSTSSFELEEYNDNQENLSDDEDFLPGPDPDSDSDSDNEANTTLQASSIFDSTALAQIHACIDSTAIPTWVERPPRNLGEKAHGKLKADQWLTLISIFLPMVLPEIWLSTGTARDLDLLDNFHDLVLCTNIVCSYTASNIAADNYLHHYIRYRQSSATLFPGVHSRPNHHFAMHNTELMKFWGPLSLLSELPYEQHNGALQKIKTNWHVCKLVN